MRIPHELRDEFAAEMPLIERLAQTNHEFRHLSERYEEINAQIHRIETDEEPTSDEVLERFKKQRLRLKDEITAALARLKHRM